MNQIIPYQDKTKKAYGLIEYLMLQKPSSSTILVTLLMASFLVATIIPWIATKNQSLDDKTQVLSTRSTNNN